jgi:hypothetical protein
MKHLIIISSVLLLSLCFAGCPGKKQVESPAVQTQDAELISDEYKFKIMDLDGYEEDKEGSKYPRTVLILRKTDIRVQLDFGKNLRILTNIPGMPSPSTEQLLNEWVAAMLETTWFYPGTSKVILKSGYREIDGYTSLVSDILLKFDENLLKGLDPNILKLNADEVEFLKNHNTAIVRTYHFYREKDLFHIEFFTDPLTFQAEIENFEDTIVNGLKVKV